MFSVLSQLLGMEFLCHKACQFTTLWLFGSEWILPPTIFRYLQQSYRNLLPNSFSKFFCILSCDPQSHGFCCMFHLHRLCLMETSMWDGPDSRAEISQFKSSKSLRKSIVTMLFREGALNSKTLINPLANNSWTKSYF